jgi:Archaeal holliday junction resolvase (hjc)
MTDPNRGVVQARLEAIGFTVHAIPESDTLPQPDLVAHAEGVTMYVEVKTRVEDSVLRARMEAVPVGATAAILTNLDKHNSLSADIKHACSQLKAAASPDDLRLLWYRADSSPFVHDALDQIGATLYGIRMVVVESPSGQQARACAYAGHADFYRFQDIDGTMVEVDRLITLLLNPFSPRRAAFAASRIAKVVHPSVFDVDRAAEAGTLFIADGEAPRHSDAAILGHLGAKYPACKFVRLLQHCAGTVLTTIDGSQGMSNTPLEPTA